MYCASNLIGIRGNVGAITQPESGLWLHRLPHIKLENIDAAIGEDAESAYAELLEIVELGWLHVVNMMKDYVSSKFRFNSVLDRVRAGYTKDNLPLQNSMAAYVGVNIRVNGAYPYLEYYCSQIGLHLPTSATIPVKVFDLISEQELFSIDVAAVAQRPTYVDVSKKIKTNARQLNIFIGYDATAVNAYKTNLNAAGFCSTCSSSSFLKYQNSEIRGAYMLTADQKIYSSVKPLDGTSGLLIDSNLNCDIERFCCSIREQLAFAHWYMCGVLILEMMVSSKRYTNIVRLHKATYEEAIKDMQIKHWNELKKCFKNLRIPKDICFVHTPRVQTRVVLP